MNELSAFLLPLALNFALGCVGLALVFCTLRLLRGPSAQDRVLALDTLWMCAMLLILLLGMRHGSLVYFEAALLIALLGFVSTVALAKFLMRGEVIE
ncbi:MAG: K+/H+ antiporter subunit F [Azonexaceae bacterium]|uniref:K+/H+ antiporter subunit F n=1 Tax=Azonexus sp. R2A61 TaxID=2744443 RepID=UPI001F2E886A|nr:K+/H+ antiporter subunit F [Azonexus sp. R2A61]MCE1238668.1 K+/H+ antiporter subunit F [Azonexaceae bacterium]